MLLITKNISSAICPKFKVYVDLVTIKDQFFRILSALSILSNLLPYRSNDSWKGVDASKRKGNRYFFIARNLNNTQIELKKFLFSIWVNIEVEE